MLFLYSFFVCWVVSRTTSSSVMLWGRDVIVLLRRDGVGLCFDGRMEGFDGRFTLRLRSFGGWRGLLLRFKVLKVFLTEGTKVDFGYLGNGICVYVLWRCYEGRDWGVCFLCLKGLWWSWGWGWKCRIGCSNVIVVLLSFIYNNILTEILGFKNLILIEADMLIICY